MSASTAIPPHARDRALCEHERGFVTEQMRRSERRTKVVIALTLVVMVAEIAAGTYYGSMALLADGWHMGTHAAALSVAVFAYAYMRRHAHDPRFTFGTGKVGALSGFGSAAGLAVVAVVLFVESGQRLISPVPIRFTEALGVAILGLLINLLSAALLGSGQHHDHAHDPSEHHRVYHDHNLRGAYLHVLADALTSVLAIVALLLGMGLGWSFLDPAMGMVGATVIARWSFGLLRETGRVLLDAEVPLSLQRAIRDKLEGDGDCRVIDLHVWRIGPEQFAVIVRVLTRVEQPAEHYRQRLAEWPEFTHVTVETTLDLTLGERGFASAD